MLNIGMTELLMFAIISLLILGPDKLPEAARFAGKFYAQVKRMISNVQHDLDRELRLSELRQQMHSEMQRIQVLEQKMQAQMQQLTQHAPTAPLSTAKATLLIDQDNQHIYHLMLQPYPQYVFLNQPSSCTDHRPHHDMQSSLMTPSFHSLQVAV